MERARRTGSSWLQSAKGELTTSAKSSLHCTLACSCCREIPHELVQAARGGEVDINIEDRRNDSFVQRAPKLVAFSGEGHKLGRYHLQLRLP